MSESHAEDDSASSIRTDGGQPADQSTATANDGTSDTLPSVLRSNLVRSLPFWLPAGLFMAVFVYGSIGWNVLISLTDWNGLGDPEYGSLNFEMYRQLLSDPTFITATRNTLILLVAFTGGALVIGLLIAILIDQKIRAENLFQTIYLLPMSLSFVVTALFWSWIYNPTNGLINVIFRTIGADFLASDWLGNPQFTLAAVIFALMWQYSGYAMIVYLAGLRAIPNDQFEAAHVDGASTVQTYLRIIIPQLRASTVSAAVVLIVFALKAFDFLYVLFGDTPGPAADILATMMFREAFSSTNWAYGSAIAVVLFVLALMVISPYLYSQYQRGEL